METLGYVGRNCTQNLLILQLIWWTDILYRFMITTTHHVKHSSYCDGYQARTSGDYNKLKRQAKPYNELHMYNPCFLRYINVPEKARIVNVEPT